MTNQAAVVSAGDLDSLSAIWILSCNDENPLLTYRGISSRLSLSNEDHARLLVNSHRELFRPGVTKSRLKAWQDEMRRGKSLPSWIREIEDTEQRIRLIDDLTVSDVFRNQFRVGPNAQQCPIEIVDWGLRHLDRLRKASADSRLERFQRTTGLILPIVSIGISALVAMGSAIGGYYVQTLANKSQFEAKRYEVTIKPKQESFSAFMSQLGEAALAAFSGNQAKTLEHLNRMEAAYFVIEPFLGDRRNAIWLKFFEFSAMCSEQAMRPAVIGSDVRKIDREAYKAATNQIGTYKHYFNENLFSLLFLEKAVQ